MQKKTKTVPFHLCEVPRKGKFIEIGGRIEVAGAGGRGEGGITVQWVWGFCLG